MKTGFYENTNNMNANRVQKGESDKNGGMANIWHLYFKNWAKFWKILTNWLILRKLCHFICKFFYDKEIFSHILKGLEKIEFMGIKCYLHTIKKSSIGSFCLLSKLIETQQFLTFFTSLYIGKEALFPINTHEFGFNYIIIRDWVKSSKNSATGIIVI